MTDLHRTSIENEFLSSLWDASCSCGWTERKLPDRDAALRYCSLHQQGMDEVLNP